MRAARILLVYGTSYGQTERIARRIAETLEGAGLEVSLQRGDLLPRALDRSAYDAVIVGASVIFGKHQRYIRRFLREQRDWLARVPSALFSVSGSAGAKVPSARESANRAVEALLAETGWRPALVVMVAGAIAYRRYNPLLRYVMRRISQSTGRPTDTSRDHELTDWEQVVRFARECAALFGSSVAAQTAGVSTASPPPAPAGAAR